MVKNIKSSLIYIAVIRGVSFLIDGLILIGVFLFLAYCDSRYALFGSANRQSLGLCFYILYFGGVRLLNNRGKTIGMAICRLSLISIDLKPANIYQKLIRPLVPLIIYYTVLNLFFLLLFPYLHLPFVKKLLINYSIMLSLTLIVPISTIFSPQLIGIHDFISKTRITPDWVSPFYNYEKYKSLWIQIVKKRYLFQFITTCASIILLLMFIEWVTVDRFYIGFPKYMTNVYKKAFEPHTKPLEYISRTLASLPESKDFSHLKLGVASVNNIMYGQLMENVYNPPYLQITISNVRRDVDVYKYVVFITNSIIKAYNVMQIYDKNLQYSLIIMVIEFDGAFGIAHFARVLPWFYDTADGALHGGFTEKTKQAFENYIAKKDTTSNFDLEFTSINQIKIHNSRVGIFY